MKFPTKHRGWIIAAAVLVGMMILGFIVGPQDSKHTGKAGTHTVSTTAPTPSPSATAASLDWSDFTTSSTVAMTYSRVCEGTPGGGSWATPDAYAGTEHPMALIGGGPSSMAFDAWENDMQVLYSENPAAVPAGLRPTTLDAVQLVACVTRGSAPAASCGTYRRDSDGAVGELRRTVGTTTIRILTASTATLVAERKFTSDPVPCDVKVIQRSSGPPWVQEANPPEFRTLKSYLARFTTGSALS